MFGKVPNRMSAKIWCRHARRGNGIQIGQRGALANGELRRHFSGCRDSKRALIVKCGEQRLTEMVIDDSANPDVVLPVPPNMAPRTPSDAPGEYATLDAARYP